MLAEPSTGYKGAGTGTVFGRMPSTRRVKVLGVMIALIVLTILYFTVSMSQF